MPESIPFTTFEEFIFWEDRPAYPWSCFFRLEFKGLLDRDLLEKAMQNVLQQHPLMRSLVQQKGRKLSWLVQDSPKLQIEWTQGATGKGFPPATYLDLRKEIGLRLHGVEDRDADRCELTIQFHHACCDGAGITELVSDFLIAYAIECGENSIEGERPNRDASRLRLRGKYGLTFFRFMRMFPGQLVGLRGAYHFLKRQPQPVLPYQVDSNDGPLPESYPATLVHEFDRQQTSQLREVAKLQKATMNELLVRDLFLALSQWRNSLMDPKDADKQWLRMMIPMNLRTPEDSGLSAANVVSCIFLDRKGDHFADRNSLLAGIHSEMELIKKHQLGLTFIFSLKAIRWLPGGLKKAALQDECSNSCILTNIGRPMNRCPLPERDGKVVAGNVTLENMNVVAPLRPYNAVSLTASQYAGRLSLTMHYDPRPISADAAADLLNILVEKLKLSIAELSVL